MNDLDAGKIFLSLVDTYWCLFLIVLALSIVALTSVHFGKNVRRDIFLALGLIIAYAAVEFAEGIFANMQVTEGTDSARVIILWRSILSAEKYSLMPFLVGFLAMSTLQLPWYSLSLALVNVVVCHLSIPWNIVFTFGGDNVFKRGPLGFMPFVVAGIYAAVIIIMGIKRSRRSVDDIVPLLFIAVPSALSLLMPVFSDKLDHWFTTTVAFGVLVYYIFILLQLTKRDSLSGLLNRHAYFHDVAKRKEDIRAILSIDMNGLKRLNDEQGHLAGDAGLTAVSKALTDSLRAHQSAYRIGGDEFSAVCFRGNEADARALVARIRENIAKTPYSISIGYCYIEKREDFDKAFSKADAMMYEEKERYHRLEAERIAEEKAKANQD